MPSADSAPYLDSSLPLDERVEDLLGRMTVEEKCQILWSDSPAIDRLGVPAYHWWNECLHGVARAGRATVFPQAIGLAATFDVELIERIARAISDEGRAKYHAALRAGNPGKYRGLTYWTPNVNIFRDPRWGRGQETYGEDPYLSGELGAAFVRGLQQEQDGYLKAAACAKHFAVHSGPEALRHVFDAIATPKDLWETYLPAFKRLVDEGVEAVMGAYNRTNGEPCCASKLLMEDILRGEWKFKGHYVSDCGALGDIHDHHKVTASAEESAALAVKRGCDINCGNVYEKLTDAITRGLITEEEVDVSVRRALRVRFRLGMFDPQEKVPWSSTSAKMIRAPEHVVLAREAAEKSIVLLKNNGVLPIVREDTPKRLYLMGHNAASIDVLLGNYYGTSDSMITVLEGISSAAPDHYLVEYRVATQPDRPNINPVDWSTPGKWDAYDAVIAVVGLVPMLEGEEGEATLSAERGDRVDIGLPQHQIQKLRDLKGVGLPLIVVLAGGSPIAIPEVQELADAILFMWYPGEQGGSAVASVIFGDISPSGKLPVTFPKSVEQLPPFDDYSMAGRTYRHMKEDPLYPFGFGLSYTTVEYRSGTISSSAIRIGETVTATATITNTGSYPVSEVAQCYITDIEGSARTPNASLCGVKRVEVPAGGSAEVTFQVTPSAMELVQDDGSSVVEPGEFRITIGACAPGKRGIELGSPVPVEMTFTVS